MKIVIDAITGNVTEEAYEPIVRTEEEIKEERVLVIKNELAILDNTINRATEDLYVLTNLTPYEGITQVINRKNELREELSQLDAE